MACARQSAGCLLACAARFLAVSADNVPWDGCLQYLLVSWVGTGLQMQPCQRASALRQCHRLPLCSVSDTAKVKLVCSDTLTLPLTMQFTGQLLCRAEGFQVSR